MQSAAPKLEVFGALSGDSAIGFRRDDLPAWVPPIVHVIAQGPGGQGFTVDGHFDSCAICKVHGLTQDAFYAWYHACRVNATRTQG